MRWSELTKGAVRFGICPVHRGKAAKLVLNVFERDALEAGRGEGAGNEGHGGQGGSAKSAQSERRVLLDDCVCVPYNGGENVPMIPVWRVDKRGAGGEKAKATCWQVEARYGRACELLKRGSYCLLRGV